MLTVLMHVGPSSIYRAWQGIPWSAKPQRDPFEAAYIVCL